ncbi:MAG: hypothetical protein V9H69_22935 [Anaerolineae bacterium]
MTSWSICTWPAGGWSRCAPAGPATCPSSSRPTATRRPTSASLREPLTGYGLDEERIAHAAIRQEEIIEANKVTDWETNLDIQNQIRSQLDDYFFDLERAAGVALDTEALDLMIEQVLEVAKARNRLAV